MNTKATIEVHNASDPQTLAEHLGKQVIEVLTAAIKLRDSAFLVVSGGSTPKALFQYLSKQDINWSRVCITVADERCVEPEDTASNAKLVKENLLVNYAASARFVSLFDGGSPQLDDQIKAEMRLLSLPRYDMVILGMGDDGHTASIFPQAENRALAQTSDNHVALLTNPITVAPLRITQTVSRLLNTRHLVIHFTGSRKATLFKKLVKSPDPEIWPISSFVNQTAIHLDVFSDELQQEDIAT